MKRPLRLTVIIAAMLALVAILLLFLQWSGLLILYPKIQGSVTVHKNGENQTYHFSSPGGEYGAYDWIIGPEELPISVHLFSRNSWHVINMNFDVEQSENAWHVTGTVNVKTYEPVQYDQIIPLSEPLVINVDCFP